MPADIRSAFTSALVNSWGMEFEGEINGFACGLTLRGGGGNIQHNNNHILVLFLFPHPSLNASLPMYRSTALCENNGEGEEISGNCLWYYPEIDE